VLRVSRSARSSRSARRASGRVTVRVIAATNRDLTESIRAGAIPRGPLLPA
jgi:transcriptional regulator with GAF, ATPase, and Fis domain